MIVLHASSLEGSLLLWGEMPRESEPAPASRRGRAGRATKVLPRGEPLPYDAGAKRLSEAVQEAVPGLTVRPKSAEDWVAWLPTVAGSPVASSPLVAEPPQAKSGVRA